MAAVSTKDVVLTLREGMGAKQADELAKLLQAMTDAIQAVAAQNDASGSGAVAAVAAILTD
jgi:ABC-type xylose transport system substrate-binding protein